MPRRLVRRWLPKAHEIRDLKSLGLLRDLLHDPNLWHMNRRSLSLAAFVGMVVAFIPLPLQMLIAAAAAVWLRCNIALSVALVWLTNPLTMPAAYYGCYRLGTWLMGEPHDPGHIVLTWSWLSERLEPFLLGSAVAGISLGLVAFVAVRVLWRIAVTIKWRQRRRARAARDHS